MTSSFAHIPHGSTPYSQHNINPAPNSSGFGLVRNTDEYNKIYRSLTGEVNALVNAISGNIKLGHFADYGLITVDSDATIDADTLASNSYIEVNYPQTGPNYTLTLPSAADLVTAVGKIGTGSIPSGYPLYLSFVPNPNAVNAPSWVTIEPPDPSMVIGSPTPDSKMVQSNHAVSILLIITSSNPSNPQYKVLYSTNHN